MSTTIAVAVAVSFGWLGMAVALGVAVAIRPALTRRSDAVLATGRVDEHRSRAHLWYVGAELIKVVALVVGGVVLLAAA